MKAILLAGEWSFVCGLFLTVLGWSYAIAKFSALRVSRFYEEILGSVQVFISKLETPQGGTHEGFNVVRYWLLALPP
jgi:hypothetical protein